MEDALLLRLQLLLKRLNDSITLTTELCVQSKSEGVTEQEISIALNSLRAHTANVAKEIHIYIEKSTEINQDIVRRCTVLQLEAEDKIIALNSILNHIDSQKPETTQQTKLPKLSLPKFNGNILGWHDFWDQFEAGIHNKSLPDVDKLSYLLASLEGTAREAVEGIGITNQNYKIVIETLKKRFGHKNMLIDSHYEELQKVTMAGSSATECRKVLNNIDKNLRILESLGEDINNNQLRVTILSKFPQKIIYELNMALKGADSVKIIRDQLEIIITAMELSQKIFPLHSEPTKTADIDITTTDALFIKEEKRKAFVKCGRPSRESNTIQKRRLPSKFRKQDTISKRWKGQCVFCEGPHYNDTCSKFSTMSARRKKLGPRCHLCFKIGHFIKDCNMKKPCYHCKGTHNRALCPKKFAVRSKELSDYKLETNCCSMFNQSSFLQTAVVTIKSQNEERKCRLLLDSGSQRSYITQQLADELKLVIDKVDQLIIFTFGSESPTQTESPSVKIELKTGRETTRKIRANVVPHITNRISVPKVDKKICVDLLADDGSAGEKIDILIGNDYYFSFFKSESKKLCDNLFLINTEFGWILSGTVDSDDQNILSIITYCQCHGPECMYYTEPDLPLRNIDLTFLWSLESIGILDSPKATREDEAVKHFNNNVKYVNQRYMIKWPWIQYPPEIPTNFGLAYGRLKGLLQRIDKNTLEEYEQILKAQLQSGTIELVEPEDDATRQRIPPLHYLPHHIVKQEGKKGRLVYDASGKLKNHKSLNECMYRGPSLIGDLLAILLQFRTYKIAITADVEKAFLQIGLQIEDRDVTRFLWLKHVNQPISKENLLHLRFCRVPFGIISSPFILTATINYHISQNYPDLLSKIADKCYVDNLVTGSKTVEEAQKLYKDTRRVFQDLSMNIREWNSNSPDFLKTIPQEYRAKTSAETKMLGLVWDTKKDTLHLKIRENLLDEQNTKQIQCKREVLSTIASVYDPCGFCSPLILPAKLLLQQLWENKLKWDTLLPEELKQKWDEVADCLRMVRNVAIPRFACIAPEEKTVTYELHCFTDASKDAYAAVLYLRSSNGVDTKVAFLISKSKITPKQDKDSLKIPKLELLGYYIGSKLILYVKNVIGLTIEHQYLWTDSMIVLGWMKSNKLLPPFVSRRINTIRQNKEIQPCYINTDSNPADVATRPDLWTEKNHLWFQGPSFLLKDKSEWPQSMYLGSEESSCVLGESLDGLCPDITMMTNDEEDINELTGCSSPKQGCYQLENTREVKNVKALQRKYFPNEVEGKVTHLTRNLGLYLDVDGVLRCRGRMANTNWSYDTKHPALIPRDSEYTSKLIQEIHEKNYHVGVSHTLSLIREKFWIPQGRAQVQKILRHCENCMKHGGGPYKLPPTSDLPAERVNLSAPFTYTGMDYFGPLYIIGEIGKEKRWVCLLTCLAVRAIHMEIVKDLTADECLLGLRRFVANRGKPVVIMTDNATLFKLTAEVVSDTIKWKFIPQLAPWHGGFYERMVGLVKHCMKRTLDKHLLRETQLLTVVKEIESVLNSRPLTCVGSEPEQILKPADFLSLGKCIALEPLNENIPSGSTSTKQALIEGWIRGHKIVAEFRKMFTTQYLFSLREKYNYSPKQPRVTNSNMPEVGDVVQIKSDVKNRNKWKVGKIISLTRGADEECRIAKVKVGNSEYTRSVGHLYPLEVNSNRNESEGLSEQVSEVEIAKSSESQETNSAKPPAGGVEVGHELSEALDDLTPIRVKRKAAIRAREKMTELTRNLLTLL